MPESISSTLAVAKQAFEELTQLVSLDELDQQEFGDGAKRSRVEQLLKTLHEAVHSTRRALGGPGPASADPPVLTLPVSHRRFYRDVLLPQGKALQRAYLEISGLGLLVPFVEDSDEEEKPHQVREALSAALERWSVMLDDDERFALYERGIDLEGAERLVDLPLFQPDDWLRNVALLQPVLVAGSPQALRNHVRVRLTEIYRAFAYGLWMAAIALSRSLVEFSLVNHASRIGIELTYSGRDGRARDKSLAQLGEEFAAKMPRLTDAIDAVRETGNRILHPKKRDVIAYPKVMRAEALDCIRAAQTIVETLQSDAGQGSD